MRPGATRARRLPDDPFAPGCLAAYRTQQAGSWPYQDSILFRTPLVSGSDRIVRRWHAAARRQAANYTKTRWPWSNGAAWGSETHGDHRGTTVPLCSLPLMGLGNSRCTRYFPLPTASHYPSWGSETSTGSVSALKYPSISFEMRRPTDEELDLKSDLVQSSSCPGAGGRRNGSDTRDQEGGRCR